MTIATAKIKNSLLTLPSALRPDWKDADVAIQGDSETLIVKKRAARAPRRLSDFGKRLQAAGRGVSVRDINAAIRAVRRERA